jgi:uncharacterized protein with NAD-binding domain and iron-sulfur cluster
MHRDEGKSRIAILGGGVGSLAAAFDLTEVDPDGELYDITIYQVGWRLGGKGAVGWTCKDYPTPTFEDQQVQLEHGLHVWAGFYDNAFDLLQRCYAAHDRPYPSYLDAFTPMNRCWVMDVGRAPGKGGNLMFPQTGEFQESVACRPRPRLSGAASWPLSPRPLTANGCERMLRTRAAEFPWCKARKPHNL